MKEHQQENKTERAMSIQKPTGKPETGTGAFLPPCTAGEAVGLNLQRGNLFIYGHPDR